MCSSYMQIFQESKSMDNEKDILKRLDNVEAKLQLPRIQFAAQYLLFPVMLALATFFFNWRLQKSEQAVNSSLEEAKRNFEVVELEVRRLEASQKFLDELFSGTVERAMLSEKLMSRLIDDDELEREISDTVARFYRAEIENSLRDKDFTKIAEIQTAAERIGSPAGRQILLDEYFVIIKSTKNRQEAIEEAQKLQSYGYQSEVILSITGYYGISLGRYRFEDARNAMTDAQRRDLAPADAYLMTGERVKEYIYPADSEN